MGNGEQLMKEHTMMYVIDRDFKILYGNDAFFENYPDIQCGQKCFKALGDRDEVCDHCPIYKDRQTNTFFNSATGEWVKAQVADVCWEGKPDCYAVMSKVRREDEGEQEISELNEEIRLQKQLLAREKELQRQQEQNMHRLTMVQALCQEYGNAYCVDLDRDAFEIYRLEGYVPPKVRMMLGERDSSYSACVETYIRDCVHEEDKNALAEALSPACIREALSSQEFHSCNYRVVRNGETTYHQAKCVRLKTPDDTWKIMLGFRNVDAQTRKEMERKQLLSDALAQAEYANQAKTAFLNNVSHDIRTAMNAILGMTAIAAMHIDDKERVMDCLNKITLSGKHLLGLINSVLDMSKIESGKISLNEEEFNLSDSVESLIALFYNQMQSKNLELKMNIATIEHEDVIGDAQRLQQIFVNIMGNAVKFTPAGGTVTMDIRERPSDIAGWGFYEFVFEDTGIGMEPEFVKRIFEPFARATDSRTSKIEGSGLGMSIAVSVARMMGGDIRVESEPGWGSRFTVTVYLKINHANEEDIKELAELRTLVVDDDEVCCVNACEILKSLSMKADYVLSGDAAIERIVTQKERHQEYSLVILDWKMPGKDGLETTREIRRVVGNAVPIIILSAYDWASIEQEALAAGVNAFIEKPLFKSRLTLVLKDVLGLSEKNVKQERSTIEQYQKCDRTGKRVLLVEDNELNVEVAGELLNVVGLEVETACNGKEAVEMVQKKPGGYYSLIFMDIQMPVMNGYEAATAIRALDREDLKNIPIFAMTADVFAGDVRRAKACGMNGHIAKPIDLANLENILEEWI
jgi:signal transduction histidine kinase/CheY-like chemotaxis protein